MVAMAHELGVHVDCSAWAIPQWEKGLRRRLAWALYMQDRWTAFTNGRPMLIHHDDWDVPFCTASDFPELERDASQTGGTGNVTYHMGWELFVGHIELSQLLGEIMHTYHAAAASRRDGGLDNIEDRYRCRRRASTPHYGPAAKLGGCHTRAPPVPNRAATHHLPQCIATSCPRCRHSGPLPRTGTAPHP